MSNDELFVLLDNVESACLRGERHQAIKLLRSIEIAALREAREVVEHGDDDGLSVQSILSALTRKITHLELK